MAARALQPTFATKSAKTDVTLTTAYGAKPPLVSGWWISLISQVLHEYSATQSKLTCTTAVVFYAHVHVRPIEQADADSLPTAQAAGRV